jgi:hypothetical protein
MARDYSIYIQMSFVFAHVFFKEAENIIAVETSTHYDPVTSGHLMVFRKGLILDWSLMDFDS